MTTRPGYVWDATASEWVEIGQAAVLAPIKYQTSQPSSPATGDIWIDSDDEVPSVDSKDKPSVLLENLPGPDTPAIGPLAIWILHLL